ncbi:MAG: LysE family translocator [Sneathiellales bacterium]|nr:LysE family translocator [Sneathiellales bacterium]
MMTSIAIVLSIAGAIFLGAMSPGPSFVLVSRISIANSRLEGLCAALGMGAGGVLFAVLALVGLTALFQQVEWLYLLFKLAGGAYLVYLGIRIWKGALEPLELNSSGFRKTGSLPKSFLIGFVTQIANPKTAVVYASIFAAFLPADPPPALLYLLPGAVFCIEFGWYSFVAILFSAHRPRAVYLAGKSWVDRAAGFVLGALGVRLISDSLR